MTWNTEYVQYFMKCLMCCPLLVMRSVNYKNCTEHGVLEHVLGFFNVVGSQLQLKNRQGRVQGNNRPRSRSPLKIHRVLRVRRAGARGNVRAEPVEGRRRKDKGRTQLIGYFE